MIWQEGMGVSTLADNTRYTDGTFGPFTIDEANHGSGIIRVIVEAAMASTAGTDVLRWLKMGIVVIE